MNRLPLLAKTVEELDQLLDLVFHKSIFPPIVPRGLKQHVVDKRKRWHTTLEPYARKLFEQEHIFELEKRLSSIEVPTLGVWGKHDKVLHVEGLELMSKTIKDFRSILLDDCGHSITLEKPRESASHLLRFLEERNFDLKSGENKGIHAKF